MTPDKEQTMGGEQWSAEELANFLEWTASHPVSKYPDHTRKRLREAADQLKRRAEDGGFSCRLSDRPDPIPTSEKEREPGTEDRPQPGETCREYMRRILDRAKEVPHWEVYIMSVAERLYKLERLADRVEDRGAYPEPAMGSDGTTPDPAPQEAERIERPIAEEHDLQTTIQGCEAWRLLIQKHGADAISEDHHRIGLAQLIKDCHRWLNRLRAEPDGSEGRGGDLSDEVMRRQYGKLVEIVSERLSVDESFDPMSLAGHVRQLLGRADDGSEPVAWLARWTCGGVRSVHLSKENALNNTSGDGSLIQPLYTTEEEGDG